MVFSFFVREFAGLTATHEERATQGLKW